MQPFDFFMLIFEHRYTHGMSMILVYLLPISIALAALLHLHEKYWSAKYKPMAERCNKRNTIALQRYRKACGDFDLEVEAWENAACKKGEKL